MTFNESHKLNTWVHIKYFLFNELLGYLPKNVMEYIITKNIPTNSFDQKPGRNQKLTSKNIIQTWDRQNVN